MSIQEYECYEHGLFEVTQRITDPVLPVRACLRVVEGCEDRGHPIDDNHQHTMYLCGRPAFWRPSAPAAIIVKGGTGP